MQEMAPRVAVVTGAGGGLGRAFCRQLRAEGGWHIVAVELDGAAGEAIVGECRAPDGSGVTAEYVPLDVTDRAGWQRLADRLAADVQDGKYAGVGLLVNNAGVCAAGEAMASSLDEWRRIVEVNFFGVLNGCQTIGAAMAARALCGAKIINVASIAGLIAAPSTGAYSASKAAVIALSEAMYGELRPRGVGVTVVAPGFFKTGLLDRGVFCTPRHKAQAEKLSRQARFTADDVARIALAASRRGQLYAVMGRRARWLWRLKRVSPASMNRLIERSYWRTFGEEG
jgi:NAD(P)-dependent dehydrogenase (short-subunit alcohol dehydrogenase family)